MWRVVGRLSASSRGVSRRMSPRTHPILAATVGGRWLSGGDDDDDKEEGGRRQDIYNNLFGSEATTSATSRGVEGNYGRGAGPARNETSKQKGSWSLEEEEDDKDDDVKAPTLQASDLPEALWSGNLDVTEERLMTKMDLDDIPDWSPDFVSRISKERVKLVEGGIPTLSELAQMPLPPPPFPHPGDGHSKEYAHRRRKAHYEHILQEVIRIAEPQVPRIMALATWQEKQDAVDELFESVETTLQSTESILAGHPHFGRWVERALESYLKTIKKNPTPEPEASSAESVPEETTEIVSDDMTAESETEGEPTIPSPLEATPVYPTATQDEEAVPVFMDCYSADDPEDQMVPRILTPLKPHHNDGIGRMVEEWELSAHRTSKRIMLRQSTRDMARALHESESVRVLVTGPKGVGKTAAIASIVAAARKSGNIVLYMPDGNRLHKHGYFVTPNPHIPGLFDVPILSQEVCSELLSVHEADLVGMEADEETMKHFFTERQLEELEGYSGGSMNLVDLLKQAKSKEYHAAMCFSVTADVLTKQSQKPFIMALDEFNCYFEPGHYFHMDYDDSVETAIPYDQINLFKPALDAIGLSLEDDEDIPLKVPVAPSRGGVIAGISENCAVARKVTDALSAYACRAAAVENAEVPLRIVEVPRFADLEVDHVIANFESIGIGNLRCDRGETVMNKEGIEYLKMISSRVGQNLLDVCCF